jgi:tripartite-type tricarboxylate transporter receptor subunit TctC
MMVWLAAVAALLLMPIGANAQTQPYPNRPIMLVVAFPPGGPSDVIARLLGKKLGEILGQPVIIDNRPGAGGNIAAEQVAKSDPDGYTLLMGNNSILATNAALYKKLNYNPERDFIPITLIGTQANILVVNPAVPALTMQQLIDLARGKPGGLNFASSGFGAAAHLAGELFRSQAKIDIVHIAYKGAAPALQDVIAGHVHMMFATSASVVSHIRSGKVRALAVTTLKRTALLPELATVDELGLAGFDANTWHGLVAPAGTSREIVGSLHYAMEETLKDPAVRRALTDLGVDILGSPQKEFEAYIKAEIPKWAAVIKNSGASMQ